MNSFNDYARLFIPADVVKAVIRYNDFSDSGYMHPSNYPFLGNPLVLSGCPFCWRYNKDRYFNGFQDLVINFNDGLGEEKNIHDELILGIKSPSVETSMTSHDDDYEDNVYMEVERGLFQNSNGIGYLYAFDTPIDLKKISRGNRLSINFLGKHLEIVGYKDPNTLLVEICNEPRIDFGDTEFVCLDDAQCEDGLFCTINKCIDGKCVDKRNCDDGRQCTLDKCNEELNRCEHDNLRCCRSQNDCVDYRENFCYEYYCKYYNQTEGECTWSEKNCDDERKCTSDVCSVTEERCINEPIKNCECEFDQDCPPGEICCRGERKCSTGGGACGG